MIGATASMFLVDALNIARVFDPVHERTVDEIFDADFRNLRIDLDQKSLQALHAFETCMRRPLVRIDHGEIGLFRVRRIG